MYVSEHVEFASAQILSTFPIYTCKHACVLNKYLKLSDGHKEEQNK